MHLNWKVNYVNFLRVLRLLKWRLRIRIEVLCRNDDQRRLEFKYRALENSFNVK